MIEHPITLPAGRVKRIHVDQGRIRANTKDGTDLPALTVQAHGTSHKAHEVEINGPSRVVYPDKPLSCGARVWIETDAEVRTILRGVESIVVEEPLAPIPTDWSMYSTWEKCPKCEGNYQKFGATINDGGCGHRLPGGERCLYGEIAVANPGDDYVTQAMSLLASEVRGGLVTRKTLPDVLAATVSTIAASFGEVMDSEPQWAIVDFVNVLCDEQGWAHVCRDDLRERQAV